MPAQNILLTANFQEGSDEVADGQPCPGVPVVVDPRDGNIYNTVQIGDQCWLKENLRYLPEVFPSDNGSLSMKRYYVFGYEGYDVNAAKNHESYDAYGVLYNFPAAVEACPQGWYLPSDGEWTELVDYLIDEYNTPENTIAYALRSCRQVNSPLGNDCNTSEHPRWDESEIHIGTDDFGFSALPGGKRHYEGGFHMWTGHEGTWWTSTTKDLNQAWDRLIVIYEGGILYNGGYKNQGSAVRCIQEQ